MTRRVERGSNQRNSSNSSNNSKDDVVKKRRKSSLGPLKKNTPDERKSLHITKPKLTRVVSMSAAGGFVQQSPNALLLYWFGREFFLPHGERKKAFDNEDYVRRRTKMWFMGGKEVDIKVYVDVNFEGDKKSRRSRTGLIVYLNLVPIFWIPRKQPTIEISAFGS